MEEYAIVVAGGSGTRMQSKTPKQFMLLAGTPILVHTLEAFKKYSDQIRIILVLPEDAMPTWNEISDTYQVDFLEAVAVGGKTRFHSVKNGLAKITERNSLVAIHDGVRPLVRTEIISASFRLAEIHGCAIASTRLKESLRMVDKDQTKSMDRARYRSIQTPQTFNTDLIIDAYEKADEGMDFTDDASVAEYCGHKISLFDGSYENIKITTREDILFAEALVEGKK